MSFFAFRNRAQLLVPQLSRWAAFSRASKRGSKRGDRGDKKQNFVPGMGSSEAPRLREVMRELQKQVHPDKFTMHPEAQAVNQESLSVLQGFLSSVKKLQGEYPPAGVHRLKFHIRGRNDELRQVGTVLKTTGGDCRKLVEVSLSGLFTHCGLSPIFRWDPGYWEMSEVDDGLLKPDPSESASYSPPPTSSPPSPPPQSSQPGEGTCWAAVEQSRILVWAACHIPVWAACRVPAVAAVPWLIGQGDGQVEIITNDVLPEFEGRGWEISEAATRIWQGERDEASLKKGLNNASQLAIDRLLYHTRAFEEQENEEQ
ncbi:hypothetical protein CYMTET_30892 [Cymbomonas tetramitiformis]|uniref:DUF4460 domain-containing protein n=1 Tax=Cymbomonas tetramitiformis TaxID=36881 RepID=A0AAE0FHW9_9CHLO|nr:hypothetical protein CYMTET_30892 [Cymbomonas tetramitiformis]